MNELRVLERRGAHDDARNAKVEPAFDRFTVPDAAAELDVTGKGLDDRFHGRAVLRFSGERAVEIDHVQVLGPRLGKQQRLRSGIVTVDGRAVHIAFGQAHDLALLEVDGGKNDHAAR